MVLGMDLPLDFATVLSLYKTSLIVGVVCFLYLKATSSGPDGSGFLAAAFFCHVIGSSLASLGLFGRISPEASQLPSLVLGVLGLSLFWIGICELSTRRIERRQYLILAAPVIVLIACNLTGLHRDQDMLMATLDGFMVAVLTGAVIRLLLDRAAEPLLARSLLAAVIAFQAIALWFATISHLGRSFFVWAPEKIYYASIVGNFGVALYAVLIVRERAEKALQRIARVDALTGTFNRRHFFEAVPPRLSVGDAVILLDVDHFKTINDRFGHAAGDRVLTGIAERMLAVLDGGQVLARFGGEEFAVFAPGLGDRAIAVAERLRTAICATAVPVGAEREVSTTISVGVAVAAADDASLELLLGHADRALYQAKDQGRDRVRLAA